MPINLKFKANRYISRECQMPKLTQGKIENLNWPIYFK